MIKLDWEIKVPKITDTVRLWFFGDQHYGARACAVDNMKEDIAVAAATPNCYVILMGDCIDCINYTDPRFDVREVDPEWVPELDDLPRGVGERFAQMCFPIKDKIIMGIPGNHEEKIRKKYHFDVFAYVCGILGCRMGSTLSRLRLLVREKDGWNHSYMTEGLLSHVERYAQTVGGRLTAAEKLLPRHKGVDWMAQAHTHEYFCYPFERTATSRKFKHGESPRTIEDPAWIVLTGSYLKTYEDGPAGYGEKRGYPPTRLGTPSLYMRMLRTSNRGKDGHRSVDGKEIWAE